MQEAGESRSDVRRPGVRTRDVRRAEMDGDDPDGWGRSQYRNSAATSPPPGTWDWENE